MRRTLRLLPVVCASALLAAVALPQVAAASDDSITLDQSQYFAHENQGDLTITIRRSNPAGQESLGYGVHKQDAQDGIDFDSVPNTWITLAPGQATYSFTVHIRDLGMNAPPVHALAYLYGNPHLAAPSNAQITILHDDPLDPLNPANPLGLSPAPTGGDVLRGAQFSIGGADSPAGQAARRYAHSNPAWSRYLSVLANAPSSRRFWFWNTPADPSGVVSHYLENVEVSQPGTTVQLTTYSLPHGDCTGHHSDSPALVQRYQNWIDGLARGIGNFHVVMLFEIDSLITSGCLSQHGLHVRLVDELSWAINRLEQDPHLVLYLDAGAADAVPWRQTARMLRLAGVKHAQGFFVNATHFDWTSTEVHYGQQISRALGGVHFVVNTAGSGRGPLATANRVTDGNEQLCNPPGRGLGPQTTNTGYKWVDAFLWFNNPGNSGGACRPGAPPTAVFWPAYAVMLVQNAVARVTGPSFPLLRGQ
jgi:endoglucanase